MARGVHARRRAEGSPRSRGTALRRAWTPRAILLARDLAVGLAVHDYWCYNTRAKTFVHGMVEKIRDDRYEDLFTIKVHLRNCRLSCMRVIFFSHVKEDYHYSSSEFFRNGQYVYIYGQLQSFRYMKRTNELISKHITAMSTPCLRTGSLFRQIRGRGEGF